MSGLESRLQAVDGVEAIELELGDAGLEGITVRLAEGADEGTVLDGVRRLLVAYGTKPRQMLADEPFPAPGGPATETRPSEPGAREEAIAEPADDAGTAAGIALGSGPDGGSIQLEIVPGTDGESAVVVLSTGEESVRRHVPAASRAIVQAVIDAGAELTHREPPTVIGLNVSRIGGLRILTVIVTDQGASPVVCTASVVERDWAGALMDVLTQVLDG